MLTGASMLKKRGQNVSEMRVRVGVNVLPEANTHLWECVCACVLGQHIQLHRPSLFFQDGDRLLVCRPLQALPVHCQDLVAPFQTPISSCSPLKHRSHLSELGGAKSDDIMGVTGLSVTLIDGFGGGDAL